MYLEVNNTFTFAKEGDIPIHLLKIFNFFLRNDLYLMRRLPNLPVKRKSIYFPQWKCFFTGALPLLIQQYPCRIVDARKKPDIDKTKINPPDWLRPFQKTAFQKMLDRERGIIRHTTATGKTYLAASWVQAVPVNHLILVHIREVFKQFQERLEDTLGEEFDAIGSGVEDYKNRRVCLGMIESIEPRMARKEFDIMHYDSILVDESHHTGWGSRYVNVLAHADNAYFRFGLTGTPKREAGDSIVHMGLIGPIIHEYRYVDAVADKYITPVTVYSIHNCKYTGIIPAIEPYHIFYKDMIVNNPERNKLIGDIAIVLLESNISTLILAKEIIHQENLLEIIRQGLIHKGVPLADVSRKVDIVHGKDPERYQKKKDFENGIIKCLITTTLYDEGIDIHRIGAAILAAGERSERALLQRIGRGQRLDEGKKVLLVFDFLDGFSQKTKDHAKQRLKACISEGYKVEGLQPGRQY
jgi:superfamily II DNA or RNA helicase